MADDGKEQSKNVWPLPKFQFEVKWDAGVMVFQEVSGLDAEAQPIEYRAGDSKAFAVTKITGTDLKSDGIEVAVESIEIAHEGLTMPTIETDQSIKWVLILASISLASSVGLNEERNWGQTRMALT